MWKSEESGLGFGDWMRRNRRKWKKLGFVSEKIG